ncbi:MAG: 23S rRNA (uracil(1939)-C(5))-methyltransferase RlmD [Proteiniphilum sp.]|nr:23S rRNA (uracil(1939)-C(5))-methyltransferase RlmD [Proteiniphilum sp.]
MTKKKKHLPLLEKVLVTDVAAEGMAIAKVEGMVLFIPFAVPGDVVDVQLTRKKSSYAEGRAVRFDKYSENRTVPLCRHFGVCGGCKWQMLPYAEQLKLKQRQVTDCLERIGKMDVSGICSPILGAPRTAFYRNKLEFTFSDKKWLTEEQIAGDETFDNMNALGFHIPGMFDKVLDIDKCWLQDDLSNRIRNAVREFCLKNDSPFFNLRSQAGLMRTLIIRNTSVGEWMVTVVFYEDDRLKRDLLLDFIVAEFPQITSLLYIINRKANDTITDQDVIVRHGRDCIYEVMEGLKFKIGPKSFFQTNSEQACNLYRVVRDFACLSGSETVYDLYTGTGSIACFIARKAKKVIGIEYVPEAILDARENSCLNGIDNTLFFAGDMKDVLTAGFIAEHGHPDVIITDPPRAGMHGAVIEAILTAAPQRIVYASCNPATQARDLHLLSAAYSVTRVQPVDMFPHTHHVENVALLERG